MKPFPETEVVDAALPRFVAQTGLQADRQPLGDHQEPGGRIRITDRLRQWVFDVECKNRVDRLAMLHGTHLMRVLGYPQALASAIHL